MRAGYVPNHLPRPGRHTGQERGHLQEGGTGECDCYRPGVGELVGNVLWRFDKRLEVMEEIALDPQGAGTGEPSLMDAKIRLHRASKRGDRKAEDEAVVDLIRAETRELWSGTPELKLLTELYRRAALWKRRKKGCESDKRRRPDLPEGLRVARRLLTDVQGKKRFDPAREPIDVTQTLVHRSWDLTSVLHSTGSQPTRAPRPRHAKASSSQMPCNDGKVSAEARRFPTDRSGQLERSKDLSQ